MVLQACRPAAPPVSVSNSPVLPNDRSRPRTKPLGDMSWTDAANRTQKLADLRGKAVILDFWATNCPPCVEEIPHLMALQSKYGVDNIVLIGLHVGDDEDRARVPKFISDHYINYPIAYPDDDLSRFIFAERDDIPQTAVFDRKGTLITKTIGYGRGPQIQLDDAIERAVASQ